MLTTVVVGFVAAVFLSLLFVTVALQTKTISPAIVQAINKDNLLVVHSSKYIYIYIVTVIIKK